MADRPKTYSGPTTDIHDSIAASYIQYLAAQDGNSLEKDVAPKVALREPGLDSRLDGRYR